MKDVAMDRFAISAAFCSGIILGTVIFFVLNLKGI
jgi:hypothetical protein